MLQILLQRGEKRGTQRLRTRSRSRSLVQWLRDRRQTLHVFANRRAHHLSAFASIQASLLDCSHQAGDLRREFSLHAGLAGIFKCKQRLRRANARAVSRLEVRRQRPVQQHGERNLPNPLWVPAADDRNRPRSELPGGALPVNQFHIAQMVQHPAPVFVITADVVGHDGVRFGPGSERKVVRHLDYVDAVRECAETTDGLLERGGSCAPAVNLPVEARRDQQGRRQSVCVRCENFRRVRASKRPAHVRSRVSNVCANRVRSSPHVVRERRCHVRDRIR
mmetsp:Transcript_947/g.3794  ORF Transcript_947/g.3794 Transcript_947/m.3794 type:complete len:278 (+) Transcript_947:1728-2561(+)